MVQSMHLQHETRVHKSALKARRRSVSRPADRVWKERGMPGTLFSPGFQLNPVAKGSPKALVLLLRDAGTAIETVASVAARWAASVPAAAFVALDGIRQIEPT